MKNKGIQRRRPSQERSQQLVKDILEATAQVLEEHGVDALSTNKVARRAGVSVGSIYQYFDDKEALLAALVNERYEQLGLTVIAKLVEIMEEPYPLAARICIEMYIDFLATQPQLTRLMQDRLSGVTATGNSALAGFDIDEERALQMISTYLLRHRDSLNIDDLAATAYTNYSVALLMGRRIALRPEQERKKLLDEVVRMLSLYVGYRDE